VNSTTISINFCLQPVELEAADKISSMMQEPEVSEELLLRLCSERLSESAIDNIHRTLAFARSLESTSNSHPSMQAYFSHPLRVATLALRLVDQSSAEIISMGLLHNVFEVTGLSESALLEAGFSERLASGIRLITIDRERQFDARYLAKFYRHIQDFGDVLALIKCVDKLDNLLAFQLVDGDIRDQYLETTSHFVKPIATQLSQRFGDYFAAVIDYMQTAGCNKTLKSQYEAFKQGLN
jgi:(p)ppGpp synthase/HD superfamily hydrolase